MIRHIAQTGDTMFAGYLDPVQAQDYFAEAEKVSVVQRVARKIPMGTTGVKIPHWTGDVSASWLGEGDMKPITKGDLESQTVVPAKIATIFVASAETVRANPANYLNTMRTKVATAIALSFDDSCATRYRHPVRCVTLTRPPTSVSIGDPDTQKALTAPSAWTALAALVNGDPPYKWTGTLLDDVAEPLLNGALDLNGRPLFVESTYEGLVNPYREGRILGRQTYISDHVANGTTVGYHG